MTIWLPPTSVRTPSYIVPSYLSIDSYGSHVAQVSTRSFNIFKKSSSLIRWTTGPLQTLRNAFWSLLFSDGRPCFTFHPSILVHSVSWRSIKPLVSLIFGSSTIPSECRADLADRPMAILLKGYGNLLPARCKGLTRVASETSRVASSWNPIKAVEMNAYFLVSFLNISIRWVDTLALHLDYDKSSRTLSLFKYPSLCAATLETTGALYAFASPDSSDLDPRADFDTITEILQETLLSYRLLFGQEKVSRKILQTARRLRLQSHRKSRPISFSTMRNNALYSPIGASRSIHILCSSRLSCLRRAS